MTYIFIARIRRVTGLLVMALLCLLPSAGWAAQPYDPASIDDHAGKPRLFVLTDMGNEPDDQMSFVRLLVYSNTVEIEGLTATTSTWLKTKVNPHTLHDIIAAYGEVRPNLMLHAQGWPEASALAAMVTTGPAAYGMAAVTPDTPSSGALALIRAGDRPDPRPLWISVWGGANTLAEALMHVRATRSPEAVDAFVAKLRVYSISDQDDAGPWLRREFPNLYYIVKPSPPDGNEYPYATWTGISGDIFYRNGEGADGSTVTNAWLETHIRAKGPLGRHYPEFDYIMEGDTPAFLGLIGNGLNSHRSPSWGGWSGRYVWRRPYGETRSMWTQGGDAGRRVTSQDDVIGIDGQHHVSDQATIWRWRTAFQHDFAARMDWTIKPFAQANHNPVAVINGIGGTEPILIEAQAGKPVTLDAGASTDPDGDALRYRWISYPEAGFVPGARMAEIALKDADSAWATVTPVAACRLTWKGNRPKCPDGTAHVILEVTDSGTPALTAYRRVIITVVEAPAQ